MAPAPADTAPPFQPIAPLGEGGFGAVWRVKRRAVGEAATDAAVKVMLERSSDVRGLFLAEVRAVASMNHPGIVRVLDYGVLDAPLVAGAARLEAGPYLLMPLAYGSLRGRRLDGEQTRRLLLAVLDALAHAHARGIIHRDIKPANILAGAPAGAPWLLADFGIAHAFLRDESAQSDVWQRAGTLRYMAPEQIEGRTLEQGPWTDLYALGCMARDLGSTAGLLRGRSAEWLRNAHLLGALPPLAGASAAYGAWLDQMSALRPQDRFQSAAEAAWALRQVDTLPDGRRPPPTTATATDTATATATDAGTLAGDAASAATAPRWTRAVPIPPRWAGGPGPWTAPPGTGASVFRLREAGVRGRAPEQAALWSALRACVADRRPQVVIVRGAAGIGKSHLARWLARTASAQVGAQVLEIAAEPDRRVIAALVSRHLRCGGVTREAAGHRIDHHLQRHGVADRDERDALLDLIAPEEGGASLAPAHRVALLSRLLERETAWRPAIVVLDDAQSSLDAIGLARHLAEQPSQAAAVVIVVAQEEALLEAPRTDAALQALQVLPSVRVLRPGPLSVLAQQALLRELVGLDELFALQLAERTAGNPLYATQLVGAWWDEGRLEVTEEGLRLREPDAPLPDLSGIWTRRLASALAGLPDEEVARLELGAVLGMAPDPTEWHTACAPAPLPTRGISALEARLLLLPAGEGGLRFAHAQIREALLAQARADGRLAGHHRKAAAAIPASAPQRAYRQALHWLGAGAAEEASTDIVAAFRQADHIHLRESLSRALEVAFAEAGLPESQPAWGDLRMRQALMAMARLDQDTAAARLDALAAAAETHGWASLIVEVRYQRARLDQERGDAAAALARFRALQADVSARGDTGRQVTCEVHIGTLLMATGHPEEGREVLLVAAARTVPDGPESGRARNQLLSALFYLHTGRGELEAAEAALLERNAHVRRLRLPRAIAMGQSMLARLRREQGDLEAAVTLLEDAEAQMIRCGAHEFALDCRVNRALGLAALSRHDEASALLTETLSSLRAHATADLRGRIHASRLACDAALGDTDRWREDIDATKALLLSQPMGRSPQAARVIEEAGDVAAAAGHTPMAGEAWELAAGLWAFNRDTAAKTRLDRKLDGMGG